MNFKAAMKSKLMVCETNEKTRELILLETLALYLQKPRLVIFLALSFLDYETSIMLAQIVSRF